MEVLECTLTSIRGVVGPEGVRYGGRAAIICIRGACLPTRVVHDVAIRAVSTRLVQSAVELSDGEICSDNAGEAIVVIGLCMPVSLRHTLGHL